jgi:hypothetical protein
VYFVPYRDKLSVSLCVFVRRWQHCTFTKETRKEEAKGQVSFALGER